MKHSALFSTALLAGLAALAGCPNMQEAKFTKASDRQLQRTFTASSGKDAQGVAALGVLISGRNEPAKCPSIVTTGATTTASGPCTVDDETWEGTLTAQNVPGFTKNPAYDATQPSTVRLDGVAFVNQAGERGEIDGEITFDAQGQTLDSHLTITDPDGVSTSTTLHLTCDPNDLCTATGSQIDIAGLGAAHIEGAWHLDEPFAGSITLRGGETLVFDVAKTTAAECVPFLINGASSGQVCGEAQARFTGENLGLQL